MYNSIEVSEQDNIIAEFMGLKKFLMPNARFEGWFEKYKKDESKPGKFIGYVNNMPYSTDWNSIMEVVGKIEPLRIRTSFINDKVHLTTFPVALKLGEYYARFVSNSTNSWYISEFKGESKIFAVRGAVSKFLEWYNVNKEDMGICINCNKKDATKDYNGHNHFVCDSCYDSLNREFDREYN